MADTPADENKEEDVKPDDDGQKDAGREKTEAAATEQKQMSDEAGRGCVHACYQLVAVHCG